MLNKIKYIFFDLDGTITDPFDGISKCIAYAAERMGITVSEPEELKCFIGPPLFRQFKVFFGFDDEKAENAVKEYRKRYNEIGWKECNLIDGAQELIKALKGMGYILAVASSKPEVFAKKILDYFDLTKYFEFIGGAQLEHTGRNEKADIIAYSLKMLKITDKSQVIMIGDRYYDIEGARINGIKSLAVLCGYGSMEEFKQYKADFIAKNMEEAGKIIQEISKNPYKM